METSEQRVLSNSLTEDDKKLGFNELYKVRNNDGTYYVYDISVSDPIGNEVTNFIVGIDSQGKIAKVAFISYGDKYAEKYDVWKTLKLRFNPFDGGIN